MSPANEVPPVTGVDTAATGWVTAKIIRDGSGNLAGGTVTFDVNFTNTGPITFTGLHIHFPAVAGANANVVINTGLSSTATVDAPTGAGNITRVVTLDPTNTNHMAALQALITAPDTAYINIHTTQFTAGVARSQMFPVVNAVAQAAGGGEWLTTITIRNPSTTTAVQGIVDFFNRDGSSMPAAIVDPNVSFLIPASGSVTISTHNRGNLVAGFAKVFSNGNVTVDARYGHTIFTPNVNSATTVTSRSVSLPISVGLIANTNTGVAIVANSTGTLQISLRDSVGFPITGGSRSIDVVAGQQIALFVNELLPSITSTTFAGTLTITTTAGTISVLALQFDTAINGVTITALP
jgi:hypothetical protein